MKQILMVLGVLWSVTALGSETVVCKQYGYAATADDFDNIKMDPVEAKFDISDTRVITLSVGRPFEARDPSEVGLEADTLVFFNEFSRETLYVYKKAGKMEIGISTQIPDSDDFFGDKQLFTECSFEPQGGSQHAVASKSSLTTYTGGVDPTRPVFRF